MRGAIGAKRGRVEGTDNWCKGKGLMTGGEKRESRDQSTIEGEDFNVKGER